MKFSITTIIAAGTIILSASTANAADYWQGQGHETGYGAVEVMPNGNLGSGNMQVTPDGYAVSDTGVGVIRRKIDTGTTQVGNGGIVINNPHAGVNMGGGHLDVTGGLARAGIENGAAAGYLGAAGGIYGAVQGVSSAKAGAGSALGGINAAKGGLSAAGMYQEPNKDEDDDLGNLVDMFD